MSIAVFIQNPFLFILKSRSKVKVTYFGIFNKIFPQGIHMVYSKRSKTSKIFLSVLN